MNWWTQNSSLPLQQGLTMITIARRGCKGCGPVTKGSLEEMGLWSHILASWRHVTISRSGGGHHKASGGQLDPVRDGRRWTNAKGLILADRWLMLVLFWTTIPDGGLTLNWQRVDINLCCRWPSTPAFVVCPALSGHCMTSVWLESLCCCLLVVST